MICSMLASIDSYCVALSRLNDLDYLAASLLNIGKNQSVKVVEKEINSLIAIRTALTTLPDIVAVVQTYDDELINSIKRVIRKSILLITVILRICLIVVCCLS